ncbi:SPFH domain-containing protein [Chloroflexus sp.]|uniref:SPFH domain-containing protein n=1 Tax=Chloroflexus sp. TaxID=1904827 RepID=UPI0026161BA7|nr:SPFH domain-containing protein [uncultured Chloroflexus sp.]
MTFMLSTITVAAITFVLAFILVPIFFGLLRGLGFYTIVHEGTCHVYTLFGSVIGVLREPGLVILPFHLGVNAFLIGLFGRRYVVDIRLDQRYLRSLPVNSEEGAPMGIGVWYEMSISDPVAFLFKNADPQGSLAANVSNAVVRTLSNMPLSEMLENRHAMSQAVRAEVSPKAADWGYRLGSVYIRKVHFRDLNMIRQIEAKVVNRLRQVTSAILQDGANRVNVITSAAERQAAIEFARAKAVRPRILGQALARIGADPEVRDALFTILELQNLTESKARVTLVPAQTDSRIIPALMASRDGR